MIKKNLGPAWLLVALGMIGPAAGRAGADQPEIDATPAAITDLPNPPEIVSRDGILRTTFTMTPARVTVAGRSFTANVINGAFVPPTLRVGRGDKLRIELVNRIRPAEVAIDEPEPTNIHYHGTDVSPQPPGDSVFIRLGPFAPPFTSKIDFPSDHPQGTHWYHTHVHHYVEDQLLSGLSGMLIVDGVIGEHYPELASLRDRVMVLKGLFLPGQNQNTAQVKTLNGYLDPPIKARPGEYQVWEIGNLGADAIYHVALEGHEFWVLERDGNMLVRPQRQQTLFMPPGARATVVVGARAAGSYKLRSLRVDTGPQGDPNPGVTIGTFEVAGTPVDQRAIAQRLLRPAAGIATITPRADEIARLPITRTRTFVFSETADGNTFFINGRKYDEGRIDTTVRLGDVERWRIVNTSGELHVFHIHQLGFLVQDIQGGSLPETLGLGMRDVVNLPYKVGTRPGVVTMIVPFNDPVMVGKFVYHCHIVGHEDAGMMANIQVLPRRTAASELWDRVTRLAGLGLGLGPLWPDAAADAPGPPDLYAELQANICRVPQEDGVTLQ